MSLTANISTDDKLETDLAYKVDPKDITNYKVLQIRTNPTVEANNQGSAHISLAVDR